MKKRPRGSLWKHKTKFKKQIFLGGHKYRRGERYFALESITGKKNTIVFESHQAAAAVGWKISVRPKR